MATYVDRKDVANEEVFLPVFARSSACTYIGVGNKKVSAIYLWGAKGALILFSEIAFCMASCSYIYIYTSIEAHLWRASLLRHSVNGVSAKAL